MSQPAATDTDIVVLAVGDCHKARAIAHRVEELGVPFQHIDIEARPDLAARFAALVADKITHAPTLVVRETAWRNPALSDIEKLLARAGVVQARPIHYPRQQRVVWHMPLGDAFASYSIRPDGTLVFGHIETPVALRGTGLGARLAMETFDWIETNAIVARLTCSFLRRVAASKTKWSDQFLK